MRVVAAVESTRRRRRVVSAGLAVVLAASVAQFAGSPAAAKPRPVGAEGQRFASVSGRDAKPVRYAPDPLAKRMIRSSPAAAVWPAAAAAVVDVAAESGAASGSSAAVRVGSLPVTVTAAGEKVSGPRRVRVEVLDQAKSPGGGRPKVWLRLARADGGAGAGSVRLSVKTGAFRHAAGGDWVNRLRFVAYPSCVLSTPDRRECRGRPVASTVGGGVVSARVSVAGWDESAARRGTGSAAGSLFAVEAGPSGPTGSFEATTVSPAGSWQAGGSSGDFNWSHPLRVPPSSGGPSPDMALAYSAQSVDGRTAAVNNQPSWIGEGWEFTPGGAIERRYKSCAEDMGNGANNTTKTGDLCWAGHNASLTLNGRTVELIYDTQKQVYRPKNEDGARIELLSDTSLGNTDRDGQYWKVTTADGTQYFFGRNRADGAKSTWTVPVYGNHSGEPCYNAAFASSGCERAWRWNLDYVVDPRGNTMSYWYQRETNQYAREGDPTKLTEYVRGGWLERIDYGTRDGVTGSAPARVLFDTADRCVPNTNCDISNKDNWRNWPDTPWDLRCTSSPCNTASPSFWTQKRLAKVRTQVLRETRVGVWEHKDVDSWTLRHGYPDPQDTTRPGLWLEGVQHTGHVTQAGADGPVSVPEVTFSGEQRPNRVDHAFAPDGAPPMNWFRINSIRNGTGGEISVQYSQPDCVRDVRMPNKDQLQDNMLRCYPVKWTPDGATVPADDYFHKYVVEKVFEIDHTGGAPRAVTEYKYLDADGEGDGGAWHWSDSDGTIPAKYQTWSQWRGYQRVQVLRGDPAVGEQSLVEYRYFRGMNGDKMPVGTRSAQVTDSQSGTVNDDPAYAGMLREEIRYAKPEADPTKLRELSGTLNDVWQSRVATATRTVDGRTAQARFAKISAVHTRTTLDGGRNPRVTSTVNTFDEVTGLPTRVHDRGEAGTTADDRCTHTEYASNTGAHLIAYVKRTYTYALPCGTDPTNAAQVVEDQRTLYDGQEYGAAPTKGLVTGTQKANKWPTAETDYVTVASSEHDQHGRITKVTDANGKTTTTAYTAAQGPVTQKKTTNALGHETVEVLDPAWALTTATIDANGRRADLNYDALGRLTDVWKPGRSKGSASPHFQFGYKVVSDAPVVVASSTLAPTGENRIVSGVLYDGFLRPRQTQAPSPGADGGRIITDTFYDTAGRASKTYHAYYNKYASSDVLYLVTNPQEVPGKTRILYDGAGREIASIFLTGDNVEKWRTTTAYGGDRVDVTPPQGGTATSTVTDARGRMVQLRQYHGPQPTPTNPASYDATTYTYQRHDKLASVTGPSGATWTYEYDLRGRQTKSDDPDKGVTTSTYDNANQLITTTDARGVTLHHSYDDGGRKTALRKDNATGDLRAKWTYDTVSKGQLTSATRYDDDDNAYTSQVVSYDLNDQPAQTMITIPASETGLAGTYHFQSTQAHDGSLLAQQFPAVGDLNSETIGYRYDALGRLQYMSTKYGAGETKDLITNTQYNNLGDVSVLTYSGNNSFGPQYNVGYDYDGSTRRLTSAWRKAIADGTNRSVMDYTYDNAGNITKIADKTADGKTVDRQCFRYDHLRRLTAAFTSDAIECPTPTTAPLAGPAPYWHSYQYDKAGNRTTKIEHNAAGDVTTTYTHDATKPHAVDTQQVIRNGQTQTAGYRYDATGNTQERPGTNGTDKLTWDPEGRVASVTTGDGKTTTYRYDANGNRLTSRDTTGATLHLPGMDVRYTTSTATKTAVRYLTHGGKTIAQRAANGLTWLVSDHHGTTLYAVNPTTQAVTARRQTPFGEPRGTTSTWVNPRGFVGGTIDPTGTIHLGAREYDPTSGRFLSVDPVIDPTTPQLLNAYSYANNSPITHSDPTGLFCDGCTTPDNPDSCWGPNPGSHCAGGPTSLKPSNNNGNGNGNGKYCGCSSTSNKRVADADYKKAQEIKKTRKIDVFLKIIGEEIREFVGLNDLENCLQADLWSCGSLILNAIPWYKIAKGVKLIAGIARAVDAVIDFAKQSKWADDIIRQADNCISNSFTPDTPVLMADGTRKPIKDVKVGDHVIATDPETGRTEKKRVTRTITGAGNKSLIKVTVDSDGANRNKPATITATDGHPFWVANTNNWTTAANLNPGDQLLTPDGTRHTVIAIVAYNAPATVHNLTVDDIHTYYVDAGETPVLVHNCNGATIDLTYKPGWTAAQIAEADAKVAALNSAHPLVVTPAKRGGTSAADVWRRAGNPARKGADIDHKVDLQLGGADDITNMWTLDSSVNRSLGAQISAQIRSQGLQPGALVCRVTIRARC
ncbi:polymorphic toxin-type HINT domain-containing protein [Micromonospora sp. NPDC047707]|uniref:polymorphic toxin-type HINT domain-containing protein n=1 Tax=Micromonospora sp. NPDC047707 TaxID=3154498 RepID=UPI0034552439